MRPRFRPLRAASLVSAAAVAVLLLGVPAGAQIGTDLIPTLPAEDTTLVEDIVPVPLPTDEIDQTVDDTLEGSGDPTGQIEGAVEGAGKTVDDTVTGLTGGGDGGTDSATDGGTGGDSGTGGSGGGTDGSSSDGGTVGAGATGGDGTTVVDAEGSGSAGSASIHGEASADDSYGSVASRATIAAAGRALHLAGPLAPAIALGSLAIVALLALGRGSESLVKLEPDVLSKRSFRL